MAPNAVCIQINSGCRVVMFIISQCNVRPSNQSCLPSWKKEEFTVSNQRLEIDLSVKFESQYVLLFVFLLEKVNINNLDLRMRKVMLVRFVKVKCFY